MVESQNANTETASMTQLPGGERQFRQKPAPRLSRESQPRKQKWSKETYIAFLAASAILVHLIIRFALRGPALQYNAPLLLTLLIGGTPLLYDLLKRLIRREFGSDLLAGMSIAAAFVLGEYLAGSIVVLMLSSGTALEQYATRRASSVLAALAKRMPRNAHRLTGSRIVAIDLDEVRVGDRLVVLPHEICPVDGTVTSGRGAMDEPT